MLKYIRKYVCDGSHEHEHLVGRAATDHVKTWTWKFARAIADGCCDLIKHTQNKSPDASPSGVRSFYTDGLPHILDLLNC